uniref:CSON012493 protein n=1 Tax=Culicoides sonorensis TaxID=179676 RepID=A0A336N0U6_CULSO
MLGDSVRVCQLNGKWSGTNPECVSKHFCSPIDIPENSTVIYATEKGTIKATNVTQYRTGTLAEIQCNEETHPDGDNLITCLNDGTWDNPPPKCIPDKITVEVIETEEIILVTEPTTETILQSTTLQFNRKLVPDKAFWKSLHSYLFFGCNYEHNTGKRSSLCDKYPTNLTDLKNIGADHISAALENTDQRLIDLFDNTLASINFQNIDIGTLFEYILYQNETSDEDKFDKNMENSFRLTLCFYINMLWNDKFNIVNSIRDSSTEEIPSKEEISSDYDSNEDVGTRIIRLFKKIVQPAYIKLIEMENNENPQPTKRPLTGLQALIASKEYENANKD